MKHNIKITIILLTMFVLTQFIGLYVINAYSSRQESFFNETTGQIEEMNISPELPFGMNQREIHPASGFSSLVFAFILAVVLVFVLMRFKLKKIFKAWFFVVVLIALSITFGTFFLNSQIYTKFISLNSYPIIRLSTFFALLIALPLSFLKIYKRHFIVHNVTELLVYPGIAVIFVSLFTEWGGFGVAFIVILLIIISIYDMWAVWHSGIMQKMAKYHMKELKIFPGFCVPYLDKKTREKIKKMKKSKSKKKGIRVNIAILGGGDIVFPIITAGVMLIYSGWMDAIFVISGATFGLAYLFFFAKKKKFYPAMPFITAGIFLGMILSFLIKLI
jgi:presenilin-like A22 family membrane protease